MQKDKPEIKRLFLEVLDKLASILPNGYSPIIEALRSLIDGHSVSLEDIDPILIFNYVESLIQEELVLHHIALEQFGKNEVATLLMKEIESIILKLAKIALNRHPGVTPAILYYALTRELLRRQLGIDDQEAIKVLVELENSYFDNYTDSLIKLIKSATANPLPWATSG